MSEDVSKAQTFCNLGIHIIRSARSKDRLKADELWYQLGRERKYHKICLSVFSTNLRAISLYKKMRFVIEGRRQEQYYFMNQWVDEILMARFL